MKYHVIVPVLAVSGYQIFSVEAATEEEAVQKWKDEGGEFVSEEVEVTDLDHDGLQAEPA